MITLQNVSSYIQQFGSLLIVMVGLPLFAKRELPIRIIVFYGINSFVFQLIGWVIIYSKAKALNLTGNLYTLSEALILLGFFYTLFKSPTEKKVVIVMAIAYVILYFVFMNERWHEVVSSTRTMRDLVMIICCIMYFFYLMRALPTTDIAKYPLFWIVAAMLSFFAGTITLSLSVDYLVKVLHNNLSVVWALRNFYRFIFCLVICYGLWLNHKQLKSNLSLT